MYTRALQCLTHQPLLVAGVVLAMFMVGEGVSPSAAAEMKIQLDFPSSAPDLLCGVRPLPGLTIQAYPPAARTYVQNLLQEIYPAIVNIYGEPLTESADGVVNVTIYHVPGADGSMYLTHKSSLEIRVFAGLFAAIVTPQSVAGVVALAIAACAALAAIPDHTLFLARVPDLNHIPNDADFDHHFTHEIIHAFHDRMDYLQWYTYSWVEEGMTEAAAELVADALAASGGRNLRVGGINKGAWDNLKHYDMWSYPFNGAWGGHPSFSLLGGLRFFFGGIAIPPPSSDVGFLNRVIEANVRYGTTASLWLLLAKALSTDPAHPDFLRRLNAQLY